MEMKTKTNGPWSGGYLQGGAAFAALVLMAAISVLASGCGGGGTKTPPVTVPTITSFAASESAINSGGNSTLSWTVSSNATSIGITGVNEVTGASAALTLGAVTSIAVSPTETTTYTLTANDSAGSSTAKVSVAVNNVASNLNCTAGGTLYTVGTGPTVVKVASAANFTAPLLFWMSNYFFSSNNNTNYASDAAAYTMDICSDSTGNFETAIAAGTYVPNIFFAADTSVQGASYATESMEYAQGYPILLGYTAASGKAKTITGITDLIQGASGTHEDISATIASGNLATYQLGTLITTGAPGALIANPIKAPYGVAAVNILNSMVGTGTVTYSSSAITAFPTWLENPTSYANITTAFNAIGTSSGAPTGFAAFSAICTAPPTGATWVRFTGADVLTKQSMANLEYNPGGGTEIYNLIKAEIGDSNQTWLKYITANYGYGSCYAGI